MWSSWEHDTIVGLRIKAGAETLLANGLRGALRGSAQKRGDKRQMNWKKPGPEDAGPAEEEDKEEGREKVMNDQKGSYKEKLVGKKRLKGKRTCMMMKMMWREISIDVDYMNIFSRNGLER